MVENERRYADADYGYVAASEEHNTDERKAHLQIYVSEHCNSCEFAYGVAEQIVAQYPHVVVEIVDVGIFPEKQPDVVFATPTYVLDGSVWSLGNPSQEMIDEAFSVDD